MDSKPEKLGLFGDMESLTDMGVGYIMFFKLTALFIFVEFCFACFSAFKVATNSVGGLCLSASDANDPNIYQGNVYYKLNLQLCTADWVTVHSVANYGLNVDSQERIWLIFFWFLMWIILTFGNISLQIYADRIDQEEDNPSDFSVMVIFWAHR